jgi:hypothetical protein
MLFLRIKAAQYYHLRRQRVQAGYWVRRQYSLYITACLEATKYDSRRHQTALIGYAPYIHQRFII